jgi:hypothetical protein
MRKMRRMNTIKWEQKQCIGAVLLPQKETEWLKA